MNQRRNDLDALRSFAMLLGVALHASFSFFGAPWPVHDSRQNILMGLVYVSIHGFRMHLFFMLSGFFTMIVFRRRGLKSLLNQRTKRIVLPLLASCITVLPALQLVSKNAVKSNIQQPLVAAIIAGDDEAVGQSLKNPDAALSRDSIFQNTMLEWAAMNGSPNTITALVQAGSPVNQQSSRGATALHLAAYYGRDHAIARLLELGADPLLANHAGDKPIDVLYTSADVAAEMSSLYGLSEMRVDDIVHGRKAVETLLRPRSGPENAGSLTKLTRRYWSFIASERFRVGFGKWNLHLFHSNLLEHLWFLWFLCWLVLAFAIAARAGWLPGGRFRWCIIPLSCVPQLFMGGQFGPVFGPDSEFSLLPLPHLLAYYGCFFFFGVATYTQFETESSKNRFWPILLLTSVFILLPAGIAFIDHRMLAVFLQPAYAWAMSFGMIGLFQRYFSKPSQKISWLSDASYWVYLTHVPLVIAAQWAIHDLELPAIMKFNGLLLGCTIILLVVYQSCVRYSLIGRILNGPRSR